jgi:hypothetical protein
LVFHHHILAFQKKTNQTIPEDVYPGKSLWSKALLFLRVFDPIQVRYAGHEWRGVIELVAKAAEIVNKARDLSVCLRQSTLTQSSLC